MSETPNNDMRQMTGLGRKIESSSFAVVDAEAGEHSYSEEQWQVVRRVIHSTADFEYKELIDFHSDAITAGVDALRGGCPVLVDVKMIEAGLNRDRLNAYGCQIHHYISDDDVIARAKAKNSTRAIESIHKAHAEGNLAGSVVAIGNAPTALLEIARFIREEDVRPALVIGVPVGFVSAAESKVEIQKLDAPYIVSEGRKGGSPIAVAIIHALLMLSVNAAPLQAESK